MAWFCVVLLSRRDRAGVTAAGAGWFVPVPPGSARVVSGWGARRRLALLWRESGLGAPADIDALNQKITHLEQQAADLRLQLEERGDELSAARTANRELMTQLNQSAATR